MYPIEVEVMVTGTMVYDVTHSQTPLPSPPLLPKREIEEEEENRLGSMLTVGHGRSRGCRRRRSSQTLHFSARSIPKSWWLTIGDEHATKHQPT